MFFVAKKALLGLMEKMEFSVPRSYSSGKLSWDLSESKLSVRLSSRSVIC